MTRRKMGNITLIILIVVVGIFAWNMKAFAGYESAEYTVVESDGSFEIRDYPDLKLAATEMGFKSQGRDGSFMRLFGYISGGNEAKQKIEMTTPVFMEAGEEETKGQMGFVIPKQVASEGAPEPVSKDVKIRERKGGRFAVIRFSGIMNAETASESEAKLREWIEQKGLVAEQAAETAGYDPPFTPGPLRRNEVLIRLKCEVPSDKS
ncbi:SOUL family heme-binding protein [Novipirellula sp. SH528]|uniref:SOUL family heme-binding protein n=1 Tax=Novipirellula sp. SH528 TaxID=3454466 RepID=UPI003F9F4DB3